MSIHHAPVDRRRACALLLSGAAALASSYQVALPASGSGPRPLFGSAVNPKLLHDGDLTYRQALSRHCRILVPEGGLKWAGLRPTPTTFDFYFADLVAGLAQDEGMELRGHTLVWHGAMPSWTKAIETSADAEKAMELHIAKVVQRYKGRIASWDVVNEPLPEDPGPPGELRQTMWRRLLGDRYVELALHMTAAADPHAELVVNEYDLEFTGARFERKRAAMLHLLERLVASRAPLHAIGLQGHLRGERDIDKHGLRRLLRAANEMRLAVNITELDVMDYALPTDIGARDRAVADRVDQLLDVVFSECTPRAVLTWGLTDRHAWIPAHFNRPDGAPCRPLPLDLDYAPKPFMAVLQRYGLRSRD